jgi:uncharacterized protein (TIGR03435 family)
LAAQPNTKSAAGQASADRLPPADQRPTFDVASIKPNQPNASGPQYMITMMQPGRLIYTGVKLSTLISAAYQLKPDQAKLIVGIPPWATSQAFDVEGRVQGNSPPQQMRLMLQSLLAERFKLAMHTETRQVPIYALVLAKAGKPGPQLQAHSEASPCQKLAPGQPAATTDFGVVPPPPPVCGRFMSGAHRLAGNDVTLEMLAANLNAMPSVDRPVVDGTGLSARFDLILTYTPEAAQTDSDETANTSSADPSAPPALPTALEEQLGLRLKSARGPVEMPVIDHVEMPTPN